MLRMNFRAATIALTLSLAAFASASLAPAQDTSLPLWPHATPEPAQTTQPEADTTTPTDGFISGHRTARLTNVTVPTLSIYSPHGRTPSNGAAALVFPGGGYRILAWDGEGLDACKWLNSLGMTCLLVKYRVPQPPGDAGHYPADPADLEDAQQAMRLARAHAADWHIDPSHIGVMGFSAGANLAVLLSSHPDDHHVESTPAAPDVNTRISARADFAIIVYPAYLALDPDDIALDPAYTPDEFTPTTFLIQAENDKHYGKNALVYYRALLDANIPAELHYFPTGGHGFGLHPTGTPEEHWTHLADLWLHSINILPPLDNRPSSNGGIATPCPNPQPPSPTSHPAPPSSSNASTSNPNYGNAVTSPNPNCWQPLPQ
jgi:acetyl esterase/lipase